MCNSAADEANTLRDIVSNLTITCNEARQNAALTRPQGLKVPSCSDDPSGEQREGRGLCEADDVVG